ncbi:MAG: hypothetical protein AAGB12_04975 [Pseudomonadota bacterium]
MTYWKSIVFRQPQSNEHPILWNASLYFFGLGFLILTILAFFDHTTINGEMRWVKPWKFFLSIGVYTLTLEWLYRVYQHTENLTQLNKGRVIIAVGMLIEASLIFVQAARGVESHFNNATPLDSLIFAMMGIAITIVVLTALYSGFVIWKSRKMATPAFSEAIVYGFVIMTLASFQGFVMTEPTPQQLQRMGSGEILSLVGSSFVGLTPESHHSTLPILGWSLEIGDYRIAHFIGLHALHFFLLLLLALSYFKIKSQLKIVRLSALAYLLLFLYAFLRAKQGLFLM